MRIESWTDPTIQVAICSYSYSKLGKQPDVRYSFNVNSLRDPIGQSHLRQACKDGRAPAVKEWIKMDPRVGAILKTARFIGETDVKAGQIGYVAMAFVDFHGIWISPAIAELVADELSPSFIVSVKHFSLPA